MKLMVSKIGETVMSCSVENHLLIMTVTNHLIIEISTALYSDLQADFLLVFLIDPSIPKLWAL